MKTELTESNIIKAIRKIERMVTDGWSISIARNAACGAQSNPLNQIMSSRPEYIAILLVYCKNKGYTNHYTKKDKVKK